MGEADINGNFKSLVNPSMIVIIVLLIITLGSSLVTYTYLSKQNADLKDQLSALSIKDPAQTDSLKQMQQSVNNLLLEMEVRRKKSHQELLSAIQNTSAPVMETARSSKKGGRASFKNKKTNKASLKKRR